MERKTRYWRICTALVIVLAVITFTPLIIPRGVYKPMVLGIPYSLWASFLITAALVLITYIGSKVHPGQDEEEEQQ
ncbi:MAG: hypothetical protein GY790_05915 [Bacteroidetes bacterium]|nr:hypothetical protein [Bacteroidota bacterium]